MEEFTFVRVWNTAWAAWPQSSGLWMLIIWSVYSLGIPFLFSLGLPVSEALLRYVQGKNSLGGGGRWGWAGGFPNVCGQAIIRSVVYWLALLLLLLTILFLPLIFLLFHSLPRRGKQDRDLFKCPHNTATLFSLWKRWRGCGRCGKLEATDSLTPFPEICRVFWNFSLCSLLPPLSWCGQFCPFPSVPSWGTTAPPHHPLLSCQLRCSSRILSEVVRIRVSDKTEASYSIFVFSWILSAGK